MSIFNILSKIRERWMKLRYIKSYVKFARHLGVLIGNGCQLIDHPNWGSEPYLITIGNNVSISHGVCFVTHDGARWVLDNLYQSSAPFYKFARIYVEDNCFIGCKSIIMPGVHIGRNSIIGAGSVVTKRIPSGEVWCGNPAHYLMTVEELSKKMKSKELGIDFSMYWKDKKKELLRVLPN